MDNIDNLTSLQVERTPDDVALNYMQHAGLTPSIEGILPFCSFELIRLSYKETTVISAVKHKQCSHEKLLLHS